MVPGRHVGVWGLWLVGVVAVSTPRAALAQVPPTPVGEASVNDAKDLFNRGSELFIARRYAEALDVMRASYKLVPSPNSGLMIARCLREINRPVEAMEMFTTVEGDARRRVADGETKYSRTAASAASEAAVVRASLGSLRIRIAQPGAGTDLSVDNNPTQIPADGVVVVWHTPGAAQVTVRRSGSPEQRSSVTVPSGGEVQMEFGATVAAPLVTTGSNAPLLAVLPPAPSQPTQAAPPWVKPAIWTSGAVTVAGFGVFAGFGLASLSEYNSLSSQCGTTCGASDRGQANTGKQNQTIANVGLVTGSIAAAATLTFAVIGLTSHGSQQKSVGVASQVRLGPGTIGFDLAW
jgi:hypothetical protein